MESSNLRKEFNGKRGLVQVVAVAVHVLLGKQRFAFSERAIWARSKPDERQTIKAKAVWYHEALKLLCMERSENNKSVTHGMGRNTHKS